MGGFYSPREESTMNSELVTGPDGSSVDITISAEQPPDVDPRIIGTYNGDGSMVSVGKALADDGGIIAPFAAWLATIVVGMILIGIPQFLIHGEEDESWVRPSFIALTGIGFLFALLTARAYWPYIAARLRYGATPAQATYWRANKNLRENCRTPHSKPEFLELLKLAQERDKVKAPAYVAERTSKFFAQLADQRGLWSQKASSAWLGPTVLQRIMDEQHPSNDPDDEMSGASEE